jgi:hypothetical protein
MEPKNVLFGLSQIQLHRQEIINTRSKIDQRGQLIFKI